MRELALTPWEWGGIALVMLGLGAALWAGPNLTIALPAAAAAVLGGMLLIGAGVSQRRRRARGRLESPDPTRFVGLRNAMKSGTLGRREVLATLRSLHRELRGVDIGPGSLEEEIRLLESPPSTFRNWVDQELALLEQET